MQGCSKAVVLVVVSTSSFCLCSSGGSAPPPSNVEPAPSAVSALAAPASVVVPQSLPAAFQFDGAVSEWGDTAPIARLDPAGTLPGQARPDSASDASAVVWLAFARDGVTLAAEVTDDVVVLPESGPGVAQKDHLALWVAFPPADMPGIGFWFWQGEPVDIDAVSWCDTEEGKEKFEAAASCRTWVAAQVTRREALVRLFTRRFLVSSAGVQEVHATTLGGPAGHDPLPFRWPAGCEGCTATVVSRAGGYSVEARIPLSALPATASDPLSGFRYRVDVTDVDSPGPASVLSTERSHAAEVSAHARLDPPRLFESDPPMVTRLMESDDAAFVFPAETVKVAYGFLNRLLAPHQVVSETDSPNVAEVRLPDHPAVEVRGGMVLYLAPVGTGLTGDGDAYKEVVAFREGVRIASHGFQDACRDNRLSDVFSKDLGPCVLVAFLCSGLQSPVGVGGFCASCEYVGYEVVAIDAVGRMVSAGDAGTFDCEGEEITTGPATSSGFTLRCSGELSEGKPRSLRVRWSQFTCPE